MIYGPAGSVFGILIGNIFDIGLHNALHTPQWHHYRQSSTEIKNMFMPALFKILGHIAKTDGFITQSDIKSARRVMREMRLYGANKRRAMQYYNEGKNDNFKLENQLQLIKKLCYYNHDLLLLFSQTQYRAAKENIISPGKQDKLNSVYILLGFKPMFPDRINTKDYYHQTNANKNHSSNKHKYQSRDQTSAQNKYKKNQTDYEILGIKNGERADVVKKAYRKMMSKIHPDKLIARGASKAEIDKATEQAQIVRAAYERIKKYRGF